MDRQETIYNNAERFAKYYYDLASRGEVADLTPHDRELLAQGKGAFVDFYSDAFRLNLEKDYREGEWDDNKAERLNKTKPYDGMVHVLYGGKGPEQKHEEAQFDKFKELVADGAWYNKKPGELSAWANNNGYSWKNPKDRQRFWDDLHRFDIAYNRGKDVEEYAGSGYGKLAALMLPSAYEEGVRQSLTGDYDDARVKGLVGTDIAFNTAIGLTPVKTIPGLGGPVVTGGIQAALEAGRQGAKVLQAPELEYNAAAPIISGTAGAGVPSLAMYLQGGLQKGAQSGLRSFGRGFARGARGVNPVADERAGIVSRILQGRNVVDNAVNSAVEAAEDFKASGAVAYQLAKQNGATDAQAAMAAGKAQGRAEAQWAKQAELGGTGVSPAQFEATREARGITKDLELLSPYRPNPIIKSFEGMKTNRNVDHAWRDVVAGNYSVLTENNLPGEGLMQDIISDGPFAKWGVENMSWMLTAPKKKVAGVKTGLTKAEQKAMLGFQNAVKGGDGEYANTVFYGLPSEQQELIYSGANKMNRAYSLEEVLRWYDKGVPAITDEKSWDAFQAAFPAKAQEYLTSFNKGDVAGKMAYNIGVMLGRPVGLAGGAIEPALTISDITKPFEGKAEGFKNSEWYNSLPEQKKNAIEAAFKKVMKERKGKK